MIAIVDETYKNILEKEIEMFRESLIYYIDHGLQLTAGYIAHYITQCAFELQSDLRVDDKGFRWIARPALFLRITTSTQRRT